MFSLLFKIIGLDKLPLKGYRTKITLFIMALLATVPDILDNGVNLSDPEFIVKVGAAIFVAFMGAFFRDEATKP